MTHPPDVRWHLVQGRPVRSLVAGEARPGVPQVVLVPGLGALGYLLPTVRACAEWTQVHLLDLPGFGHRLTARLPADLPTVADVLAGWLSQVPAAPVLLVGHSTGAQAALKGALAAPDAVSGLVMAGATFAPDARRLAPLAVQVARTLPYEALGELPAVAPYYVRGARGLPVLLRTALADRPEDGVPRLVTPLTVVRGRHDGLCPRDWALRLAQAAPEGRLREVPGAHNSVYTAPEATSRALREAAMARPAGAASGT